MATRNVFVRVTEISAPDAGTAWRLYGDFPNEFEAGEAAVRAVTKDSYAHAEVIAAQRFSREDFQFRAR